MSDILSRPSMSYLGFCRRLGLLCLIFTQVRAESWSSLVTGGAMELKMLEPDDAHRVTAVPVVFYLCNLASPRVGTVDDEILIRELRSSGHLVAIIDYAGHAQARVPFLNPTSPNYATTCARRKFYPIIASTKRTSSSCPPEAGSLATWCSTATVRAR
jgi:hypothetical protein